MSTDSNVLFVGVFKFHGESYVPVDTFENNVKINKDTVSHLIDVSDNINEGNTYVLPFNSYKLMLMYHNTRVFVVICQEFYPNRCMHKCLSELIANNDSGKLSKDLLIRMARKYDEPDNVDKLYSLQKKVDVVKLTMTQNIDSALENVVKLETIEIQAENLMKESSFFRDKSRLLKNKMWWNNMKMRIYITLFVLTVLGVVIGIAVAMSST